MEHRLISQLHQALKLLNSIKASDPAKVKIINSALMNANDYLHAVMNGETIEQVATCNHLSHNAAKLNAPLEKSKLSLAN